MSSTLAAALSAASTTDQVRGGVARERSLPDVPRGGVGLGSGSGRRGSDVGLQKVGNAVGSGGGSGSGSGPGGVGAGGSGGVHKHKSSLSNNLGRLGIGGRRNKR